MPKTLTESAIGKATREAAATKTRIELADGGLPGLRLRITPGGSRAWVLGVRDRLGRPRRFALGHFPTLSISDAREAARAERQKVKAGADPIAERRRDRKTLTDAKAGKGTLTAVLDAYGADAGAALRSWPHSRKRVERVFARYLEKPAKTLLLADLLIEADQYSAKASAAFAVRTLRPVLKWAAPRGLVPADLALIQRKDPLRRRERHLSRDELAALLPVLKASKRPHAAALRFMLLTLARREEVCTARWCHVDLEASVWTIPAPMTKNRQPHQVPLSSQAVALLTALQPKTSAPDRLVFAVQGQAKPGQDAPMTALGNWDRETKALQVSSKTKDWHRHDLRRTGATMLGDLGELPDIIEAALNHVAIRSALAATYNRSRYRPQVATALQRLADELDEIEKSKSSAVPPAEAAD